MNIRNIAAYRFVALDNLPVLRQSLLELGAGAFQLSGGILRYLERVGSAHYRGACFVFDERVGLDANLAPQKAKQL